MPDPAVYTVGWICAIATEYTAARQFLDEMHDSCTVNDGNQYTLGKMAGHNVVIAVLPNGEYGKTSATGLAKDMLHSFSNIRVGLMVGVGGGAPTMEHDIRLGDVVVSSPHDGKGGVYQYDFGKTIQNQKFQQTGFLNQPPAVLRSAVNGVVTMYEEDGHQIKERIQAALDRKPNLKKKYSRPSPESDRLYVSKIVHPLNDQRDCEILCGSQASDIVQRCGIEDRDDDPTIHYGTIASADTLMKDARMRDALAKEQGILCFEMEAAGLMNHFPCLVVRGICDYSDSHKNKRWQGYAAMTAAAYAKDILVHMAPKEVEMEKKIVDVLASMEQNITRELAKTDASVCEVKLDVKDQQIHGWLSPPDPSTNFNEALLRRHEGTGQWFVKGEVFQSFKRKDMLYLWLSGMAGCGKTVLSASIIDNLQQSTLSPPAVLLYFYFDFNDIRKQTLGGLLRSLLWQLKSSASGLECLHASYKQCQNQPSTQELGNMLEMIFSTVGRVVIVLDALDECTDRSTLLNWLAKFATKKVENVQIVITSRKEYDIEVALEEWMTTDAMISIQSSEVDEDIRAYVRARIFSDKGFKRWESKPEVQDDIVKHLMGKAQGMFRWAACQLDSLAECINVRQLKMALSTLPTTLHETYDRMLDRVPSIYTQDTIRLLQILIWSEKPLLVDEIVDFLAVDLDSPVGFDVEDRLPAAREVVQLCSGLVTLAIVSDAEDEFDLFDDPKTRPLREEIHLAHFSVKEYLVSDRVRNTSHKAHLCRPKAAACIASVSLTYLLRLEMNMTEKTIRSTYSLAVYTAEHWMQFASVADPEDMRVQSLIDKVLLDPKSRARWLSVYDPETLRTFKAPNSILPEPLYYASLCGLEQVAIRLLRGGADPNTVGGEHDNALQAAAARGHGNIAKLLIDWGANVNVYKTRSALEIVSRQGSGTIARLLLANGAHVNAQGGMYGNALQAACAHGNVEIVRILLAHGADSNLPGGRHGHALQAACAHGEAEIVRILLNHGVNVNARGGDHGSAFYAACARDNADILGMLLASGAASKARDVTDIVRILQDNTNGVEPRAHLYSKVLEKSLIGGNSESVRTLLGLTPIYVLEYIARPLNHKTRTARLELLTPFINNEDATRVGAFSRNLLHFAAWYGVEATARRCLEAGADLHARDKNGMTPLHYAACDGSLGVVKLLVYAGSDRHALDRWKRTPLDCAQGMSWQRIIPESKCHPAVVVFLDSASDDISVSSANGPRDSAPSNDHLVCS